MMRAPFLLLLACGAEPVCPANAPYVLTVGDCKGVMSLGHIEAGEISGGKFSLDCGRAGTVGGYCGAADVTLHLDAEPRQYGDTILAVAHIYDHGVLSGLAYIGPVDFVWFDTTAAVENFQAVP